jgi:hypothetical protein
MTNVAEDLSIDLAMASLKIDDGGTMTYALLKKHCDWSIRKVTMNVHHTRLLLLDNLPGQRAS